MHRDSPKIVVQERSFMPARLAIAEALAHVIHPSLG
jgi:hypothetical protein